MTTNTLYGSDCACACASMPRTGQYSLEIDLDGCTQKIDGFFHRLWMAIAHGFERLFSFEDALPGSWIKSCQARVAECVEQYQLKREEGRKHWMRTATTNLASGDLPAANMIDLDSRDFVRNEDYRISVPQAMGQVYIDAETIRNHNQKMWY
jgi:hypothetical protein